MKSMTKNLMAAALLMALPVGASFACTTTAWNGNTGAAAGAGAEAGGPVPATGGFARYSGSCALRTGTGEFVTDNTPGGTGSGTEAVYRARFYVLTSSTGAAKVAPPRCSAPPAETAMVGPKLSASPMTPLLAASPSRA